MTAEQGVLWCPNCEDTYDQIGVTVRTLSHVETRYTFPTEVRDGVPVQVTVYDEEVMETSSLSDTRYFCSGCNNELSTAAADVMIAEYDV